MTDEKTQAQHDYESALTWLQGPWKGDHPEYANDTRLAAENARLREVLKDTPYIGKMAAFVFSSSVPGMENREADAISEWLDRRRKALGESEAHDEATQSE